MFFGVGNTPYLRNVIEKKIVHLFIIKTKKKYYDWFIYH